MVQEDTFIIVPSVPIEDAAVFNPETNRRTSKSTRAGTRLIEKYTEAYLEQEKKKKASGKLIYIPHDRILGEDLVYTEDGVELASAFLNAYVTDKTNEDMIVFLDIKEDSETKEQDIILNGLRSLGISMNYI